MAKNTTRRKFIGSTIASVGLLGVTAAANVAANKFSSLLDHYVGGRPATVEKVEGSEGWDAEYYTADYRGRKQATEAANELVTEIEGEGIVLMKNDNAVLPLSTSETVSMLGRYAADPVYGGAGSGTVDANSCINFYQASARRASPSTTPPTTGSTTTTQTTPRPPSPWTTRPRPPTTLARFPGPTTAQMPRRPSTVPLAWSSLAVAVARAVTSPATSRQMWSPASPRTSPPTARRPTTRTASTSWSSPLRRRASSRLQSRRAPRSLRCSTSPRPWSLGRWSMATMRSMPFSRLAPLAPLVRQPLARSLLVP